MCVPIVCEITLLPNRLICVNQPKWDSNYSKCWLLSVVTNLFELVQREPISLMSAWLEATQIRHVDGHCNSSSDSRDAVLYSKGRLI